MDPSGSLVSVVIPTFNRRPSLAKILNPVLEDPRTGEVVVVIDGGTDGSLEFLSEWARVEPRIRVIFQENAGEGAARRMSCARSGWGGTLRISTPGALRRRANVLGW